jgi:hypothetical protein
MNPIIRRAALLAATALLAACSSTPTTGERGWIGGRFADVSRETRTWEPGLPGIQRDGTVVGMPKDAAGDSAALVTAVFDGDPLARAGLASGDLVLSIDGKPVEGALDLRERCESLSPGTAADVAYWRAGETRRARVVVGRETFASAGQIGFGLGLSPTLDLWPFDDGIDVFGLLRVRWDHQRYDVVGPEAAYLRALAPDENVEGPRQESTDVWLLIGGVSKGKRVVRQETLP